MESDSQKRLFLAIALSFVVVMLYTQFFAPPVVPPLPSEAPSASPTPAPSAPATSPSEAAQVEPTPAPTAEGESVRPPPPPVRELERRTDALDLLFSSAGAGLKHAELQGEKTREQATISFVEGVQLLLGAKRAATPQMNLAVPVPGEPLPLSVAILGDHPLSATARYAVEEDATSLVFVAREGIWEVRKRLELGDQPNRLRMKVDVRNTSAAAAKGALVVGYARAIDPTKEEKASFFGGVGNESRAACAVAGDYHHLVPKGEPPVEHSGPVRFFGIDQQYFLSAVYPISGPVDGRCVLTATPTARSVAAHFPVEVAPGQSVSREFGIFLGPKDTELLSAVEYRAETVSQPLGLDATVDFGIWAALCKVLLVILRFFHTLTGNWGVAIILLTVVVKLALLPLTHKMMVSAEEMKKLQPRMEEIRKKYAEDRDRMNQEVMKLYQEAKVNPLGGCLPLLVQLPIWGALFFTLRASYEIYGEPFFGPIWADLTYKDPTYFLPIALGITTIITQRLQPQMMDPVQARIFTYVMPAFFTLIMLQYPAGLSIYIFTNNLLSIAQTYGLRRYLEAKGKREQKR